MAIGEFVKGFAGSVESGAKKALRGGKGSGSKSKSKRQPPSWLKNPPKGFKVVSASSKDNQMSRDKASVQARGMGVSQIEVGKADSWVSAMDDGRYMTYILVPDKTADTGTKKGLEDKVASAMERPSEPASDTIDEDEDIDLDPAEVPGEDIDTMLADIEDLKPDELKEIVRDIAQDEVETVPPPQIDLEGAAKDATGVALGDTTGERMGVSTGSRFPEGEQDALAQSIASRTAGPDATQLMREAAESSQAPQAAGTGDTQGGWLDQGLAAGREMYNEATGSGGWLSNLFDPGQPEAPPESTVPGRDPNAPVESYAGAPPRNIAAPGGSTVDFQQFQPPAYEPPGTPAPGLAGQQTMSQADLSRRAALTRGTGVAPGTPALDPAAPRVASAPGEITRARAEQEAALQAYKQRPRGLSDDSQKLQAAQATQAPLDQAVTEAMEPPQASMADRNAAADAMTGQIAGAMAPMHEFNRTGGYGSGLPTQTGTLGRTPQAPGPRGPISGTGEASEAGGATPAMFDAYKEQMRGQGAVSGTGMEGQQAAARAAMLGGGGGERASGPQGPISGTGEASEAGDASGRSAGRAERDASSGKSEKARGIMDKIRNFVDRGANTPAAKFSSDPRRRTDKQQEELEAWIEAGRPNDWPEDWNPRKPIGRRPKLENTGLGVME